MQSTITALLLTISLIVPSHVVAEQQETTSAATLHAEHCQACHINITDGDGSVIYTRSDRLAKNETELLSWVRHFSDGLDLELSDTELTALRNYIKNTYYQKSTSQ